ncbi:hypothetical protein GUITHDRAFT_109070 [Guillardia theta CCMP2712]|uniref:Uncharacterized protein n=1 Tax=Guillardia theta (strain CCMP2712) TaxID=905079 RepID=L1JAB0_GUITC|nr:hypothetical protein GUITHDRAFT_109070 [Guillardia theta CCMP2712]EKX45025.1 hypothetical protein GUITHDRAFT_109070 [Guillardia theta CCMP2712]|eukprot:XP_005832005.1 hypothetical protein GUITHDRAFT_109070 [Guillardia theta CCMP2712]
MMRRGRDVMHQSERSPRNMNSSLACYSADEDEKQERRRSRSQPGKARVSLDFNDTRHGPNTPRLTGRSRSAPKQRNTFQSEFDQDYKQILAHRFASQNGTHAGHGYGTMEENRKEKTFDLSLELMRDRKRIALHQILDSVKTEKTKEGKRKPNKVSPRKSLNSSNSDCEAHFDHPSDKNLTFTSRSPASMERHVANNDINQRFSFSVRLSPVHLQEPFSSPRERLIYSTPPSHHATRPLSSEDVKSSREASTPAVCSESQVRDVQSLLQRLELCIQRDELKDIAICLKSIQLWVTEGSHGTGKDMQARLIVLCRNGLNALMMLIKFCMTRSHPADTTSSRSGKFQPVQDDPSEIRLLMMETLHTLTSIVSTPGAMDEVPIDQFSPVITEAACSSKSSEISFTALHILASLSVRIEAADSLVQSGCAERVSDHFLRIKDSDSIPSSVDDKRWSAHGKALTLMALLSSHRKNSFLSRVIERNSVWCKVFVRMLRAAAKSKSFGGKPLNMEQLLLGAKRMSANLSIVPKLCSSGFVQTCCFAVASCLDSQPHAAQHGIHALIHLSYDQQASLEILSAGLCTILCGRFYGVDGASQALECQPFDHDGVSAVPDKTQSSKQDSPFLQDDVAMLLYRVVGSKSEVRSSSKENMVMIISSEDSKTTAEKVSQKLAAWGFRSFLGGSTGIMDFRSCLSNIARCASVVIVVNDGLVLCPCCRTQVEFAQNISSPIIGIIAGPDHCVEGSWIEQVLPAESLLKEQSGGQREDVTQGYAMKVLVKHLFAIMTMTEFVTHDAIKKSTPCHQPVQEAAQPDDREPNPLHRKLLYLIQIQHKALKDNNLVTEEMKKVLSDVKLECKDGEWAEDLPCV